MLFNDRYNKNGYGWVYKNYFLYIFFKIFTKLIIVMIFINI